MSKLNVPTAADSVPVVATAAEAADILTAQLRLWGLADDAVPAFFVDVAGDFVRELMQFLDFYSRTWKQNPTHEERLALGWLCMSAIISGMQKARRCAPRVRARNPCARQERVVAVFNNPSPAAREVNNVASFSRSQL
jgi:hypothetical protein